MKKEIYKFVFNVQLAALKKYGREMITYNCDLGGELCLDVDVSLLFDLDDLLLLVYDLERDLL